MAKQQPQRKCLGCQQVFDKKQLLRFVASPAGELLFDLRQKLPGRGAYLCRDASCLGQAVRKKAFGRTLEALRRPVERDELVELLRGSLLRRFESLIGMARKAGQLRGGSSLVMQALDTKGAYALVVVAEDVSEGIGEKVVRKAAAAQVECVRIFDKVRLGALVGREQRSVLAFEAGGLADEILQELRTYRKVVGEL